MAVIRFTKPVANQEQPQGRVALKLRELALKSDIKSKPDFMERAHFAGSTLSEAMGGNKRQGRNVITGIVKACVADQAEAEAIIARLIETIEEIPQGGGPNVVPSVEVKPPSKQYDGGDDIEDADPNAAGSKEPDQSDDADGQSRVESSSSVGVTESGEASGGGPGGPPGGPSGSHEEPEHSGETSPHKKKRGRWIALAAVLVLLLLAVGGYFLIGHPGQDTSRAMCGPGVPLISGQCIGVSDGSVNVASDPTFTTVLGKIHDENTRVLADPTVPVVSIAYLMPIPATPDDVLSAQYVRELQGAYEMQLQRNERGGPNLLGGTPRVQLLVGNLGQSGNQQQPVVDQLRGLAADRRAPLVAVAGLDQSLGGVRDAIANIGTNVKVPMVGARITGDDVSPDPEGAGFFAVSPSLKTQVAAIVARLGPKANVLLVEDRVPGDLYGPVLATQFRTQFSSVQGAAPLPDPVPFNSGLPGAQTAINQVNTAVCSVRPSAVFFAGRGKNLADLIRTLGARPCKDFAVNVITSSDGHLLADVIHNEASDPGAEQTLANAMRSNITVSATAQAHPDLWRNPALVPQESHAVLDGTFGTAYPQQFPVNGRPGQVDPGGDTIMGHDAMQVLVEGLDRARPPQDDEPITPALLRQALGAMGSYSPVYGASGPIYFQNAGFAVNKNIPLTTIDATGTITLVTSTLPVAPQPTR